MGFLGLGEEYVSGRLGLGFYPITEGDWRPWTECWSIPIARLFFSIGLSPTMSSMQFLSQFLRGPTKQHYSGRAIRGLFAGKDKGFGNNVSFSKRRTRRDWKVNAQWKKLYSESLDESIRLHVSTHALRSIDKAGGLDNYLLQTKNVMDIGTRAMAVKERILVHQQQAETTA